MSIHIYIYTYIFLKISYIDIDEGPVPRGGPRDDLAAGLAGA